MAWTYDVSQLGAGGKDAVRLQIGDTDSADPQLQDEEIQAFVASEPTLIRASIECAQLLVSRYARQAFTSDAGAVVAKGQRAEAYRKLVADLIQKEGRSAAPAPIACTTQAPPDAFSVGMHDHT